ncbi:MAG: UDP-N-acetylglucosamine--N-acetylmuramyl-(pentapeptide) pyrophosphoryl-undecaprenol N-acetylglucosamine transferase [Gammaproteobacteria bacterium]|jgi:UDP-N-acetylglucosamine--N-acetylmuramyl-(pentapeptide) pyrophosphoryl-undecaprenol N-acetylglucosamine transferase|tara:strand:+ start:3262 stop:4314 length:1053 start_codon:yes stop_codon:yes gene_type:complete
MKILVTAAKTGGHIFPAIAVGSDLIKNGHEVIFLGSGAEIERNALKDTNLSYFSIQMEGYRGKGLLAKIKALLLIPKSIYSTAALIKKEKIDAMIGFGGFITVPSGIACFLMRKPLFTHEQNSIHGSANKLLSKIAKINFLGFPLNSNLKNEVISGNPIRDTFISSPDKLDLVEREAINIYVTGGSQGSEYINNNIPIAFKNSPYQINIKHQCGVNKLDSVIELYSKTKINFEVREFYKHPENLIEWSDFIISRSGALSISEITSMSKGILMIPLPSSIDNHQFYNAKHIESINMGIIHLEESGEAALEEKISNIISQNLFKKWKENNNKDHIMAAQTISKKVIESLDVK